jgi:predicted lipid-binding transport protein (Tim44 family)
MIRARATGLLMTMVASVLLGPSVGAPLPAQQALSESTAQQQQHAADLLAQAATVVPGDSRLQPSVTFGSPETYRWEGALIGGIIGGLGIGYMFLRVCYDDCVAQGIVGFVTGAALGGFTGMLIGGLFSKQPPVRNQEGGPAEQNQDQDTGRGPAPGGTTAVHLGLR